MDKTVEYPIRKDQNSNLIRFRKAYDNGGKTIDRYTVTFEAYNEHSGKWDIFTDGWNVNSPINDPSYKKIYCLCMNSSPFHPQGFGQSGTCVEGRHLGKRVRFSSLPSEVQKCIIQYMES
jgi:hypothetical protein